MLPFYLLLSTVFVTTINCLHVPLRQWKQCIKIYGYMHSLITLWNVKVCDELVKAYQFWNLLKCRGNMNQIISDGNVKPLCMVINLWPSRYIIIIFTRIHIYRKCSKTIHFPFFNTRKQSMVTDTLDVTWYCFRFVRVRILTLCYFRDCDKQKWRCKSYKLPPVILDLGPDISQRIQLSFLAIV